MFGWLKELLDIRFENKKRNSELKIQVKEDTIRLEPEYEDSPVCESCETLKQQLSIANEEKKQLLARILDKPEKEVIREVTSTVPIPVGNKRWAVQRNEMEANDRRKAALLANKETELKAVSPEEIKEFEQELDNAANERQATKS